MIDRQENVERLERVALYEQERLRARVIAAEEKFERQQSHKRELIERTRKGSINAAVELHRGGTARHLRVGAADAARRRHRAAGAASRPNTSGQSAASRRRRAKRPRALGATLLRG